MAIHLALHREANRRKRSPTFAALSRAAAESIGQGSPAPLAEAARRSGASADDVVFAASMHGVSGLLSALAERQPGVLAAELEDALADARSRAGERGRRLLADLLELGARAQRLGLPFTPLKGMDLLARFYGDPSLRPCADLDLLAPDESFAPWERLLVEAGYEVEERTPKNVVYRRRGARPTGSGYLEDPENPRPVELHATVKERFLGRLHDVTPALVAALRPADFHGLPALLPMPGGLAVHLFAHAAPAAIGRGLRLVQIHDFRALPDEEDVGAAVADVLGEAGWGVGALVARALPGALGPRVLAALERRAPSRLRRRAWLSRPGLLTGGEQRRLLVLAELPLCASVRDAARRCLDALPEPAILRELYGPDARGLAALGRYYRDRFS